MKKSAKEIGFKISTHTKGCAKCKCGTMYSILYPDGSVYEVSDEGGILANKVDELNMAYELGLKAKN